MQNVRLKYPLKIWRPFFDIGICYLFIGLSIYISSVWIWFTPIALFVIANRILALSLVCHEGLHGTLFENAWLNHFVGRWLCAFPSCISFSKYKKLHLIHHSSVGHTRFDPDYDLYKKYPVDKRSYFFEQFFNLVTLKTTYSFMLYYTEVFDFLKPQKNWFAQAKIRIASGDFLSFLSFFLVLFGLLTYFQVWSYYYLFYIVPLVCIIQPYVLLMGALQHGPLPVTENRKQLSRNVIGPKFFIEMVLPLNINFHAAHHYNSAVPHYWLDQYSKDLTNEGIKLWQESYGQSLNRLFSPSKN